MEVRVFGVCDVAKGLKAFGNKRKMSFNTSFFPSNFALWDCLCFISWQTKQHKMRHDLQKRRFHPDFGTTPSYPFSDITNDSTTPLQLIQCGHFFLKWGTATRTAAGVHFISQTPLLAQSVASLISISCWLLIITACMWCLIYDITSPKRTKKLKIKTECDREQQNQCEPRGAACHMWD